jgi:hypothetical protein
MLGWPEDDAGMCSTCGGQHEKIGVACYEDAIPRECECELLRIRSAAKPLIERCRNIDASLPESGSNGRGDVLVEVVFDRHPSTLSAAITASSSKQAGARLRLQRCDEVLIVADLAVDGLAMIVVVRQRRINVCQRQVGKRTHDFIRRLPRFSPNNDVLDSDSRSGDARLSAAHLRARFDVNLFGGCCHVLILDRARRIAKQAFEPAPISDPSRVLARQGG